jgi:hypothetical protein
MGWDPEKTSTEDKLVSLPESLESVISWHLDSRAYTSSLSLGTQPQFESCTIDFPGSEGFQLGQAILSASLCPQMTCHRTSQLP